MPAMVGNVTSEAKLQTIFLSQLRHLETTRQDSICQTIILMSPLTHCIFAGSESLLIVIFLADLIYVLPKCVILLSSRSNKTACNPLVLQVSVWKILQQFLC
jgi:hypothetical protein